MAREPDAPAESRTGSIRACGAPQAAVRLGAARDDPARGSGLVTFGPDIRGGCTRTLWTFACVACSAHKLVEPRHSGSLWRCRASFVSERAVKRPSRAITRCAETLCNLNV